MMSIAYDVLTAAVAGTMVGNEFAITAFVHPQLNRLSPEAHADASSSIARALGKVMPFWYAVTFLLILGALFEHRPITGGSGIFIAAAALLWATAILFSITILVPINNRIASIRDQPHPTWLQDRCRWDRLHRIRVEILIVGLLLLLTGLFGGFTVHPG